MKSKREVTCLTLPHITLVLPPDVRLIDKLAERAVHDYFLGKLDDPVAIHLVLTLRTAKANPSIDL
jgi:hypothetical protein